eukprot:10896343-Heterocapsa_arctica.AAC.1
MFNTPSNDSSQGGGSEYSFTQGGDSEHSFHSSPIVDTRREARAHRIQAGYDELEQAEREVAKQKSKANAEMAKQMFIEIKNKETRRAWASTEAASSS